jgi:tetratricopeptide (TPR) repeat protein
MQVTEAAAALEALERGYGQGAAPDAAQRVAAAVAERGRESEHRRRAEEDRDRAMQEGFRQSGADAQRTRHERRPDQAPPFVTPAARPADSPLPEREVPAGQSPSTSGLDEELRAGPAPPFPARSPQKSSGGGTPAPPRVKFVGSAGESNPRPLAGITKLYEGAAKNPAVEPPFLRPQSASSRLSKRGIALVAIGFAAIALFVWWLEHTPAQSDREVSSLRNSAVSAIRAKDWSKAGSLIDALLAKLPTDVDALEWRKLMLEGRTSDLFAKLNSKQPAPNGASVAKAEQLLQQGDYPAAITLFQTVLANDPDNIRARNGLKQASSLWLVLPSGPELTKAEELLQQGDYPAAIALFQRVLRSDPGNTRARNGLKRAKDGKAAEDALSSKQREASSSELTKAEELLQQGDYPAAIALFQRVLRTDPGNTRARNGLKRAKDAKAIEDSVFGGGR